MKEINEAPRISIITSLLSLGSFGINSISNLLIISGKRVSNSANSILAISLISGSLSLANSLASLIPASTSLYS